MSPVRAPDSIDTFDVLARSEAQTNAVDSLFTSYAPEFTLIQDALVQDYVTLRRIEEDMEECRIRIARAHGQMRLLERRREALQHRVFIHRARLSPLRTVPDQTLQEIFQYCLSHTHYVVPNARSAPLLLTHVCRRWRAVAHSTSEPWSSVALRDHGVWNSELEVEMMNRWLYRSYMRPMRMAVTCPPCTDSRLDGNAFHSDIFQLAIAHGTHPEDVYLNVHRAYLYNFLNHASLPVLRSLVVSLQSLEVCLERDMLDFGDPATLDTLFDPLTLPRLHTLTIAAPLNAHTDPADEPACRETKHAAWLRRLSVVAYHVPEMPDRGLSVGNVSPR